MSNKLSTFVLNIGFLWETKIVVELNVWEMVSFGHLSKIPTGNVICLSEAIIALKLSSSSGVDLVFYILVWLP